MTFEASSEFPSRDEQLNNLNNEEKDIKENLRQFGVDENQVEDLLKGFPSPGNINDDIRKKVKEEIEKLRGIKIRKDFLENKGSEFPPINPKN